MPISSGVKHYNRTVLTWLNFVTIPLAPAPPNAKKGRLHSGPKVLEGTGILAEAGGQAGSSAAAADQAESGEARRNHCPSRQFRHGGHAQTSVLLDRVIAASRLIERIVAGRVPPEVPIAARVLGGDEQEAVNIEGHSDRMIHVVVNEQAVAAIGRARKAWIGDDRADCLINRPRDDAGNPGDLVGGVDRELACRGQFVAARLKGEVVSRTVHVSNA